MPSLDLTMKVWVDLPEILESNSEVPALQVLCCFAVAIGFGLAEDAGDGWISVAEWLDQQDLHPEAHLSPRQRQ